MAYNRRTIWFDKQGTKHVAYLTMGDAATPAATAPTAPASLSLGTIALLGAAYVVGAKLLFGKKRRH